MGGTSRHSKEEIDVVIEVLKKELKGIESFEVCGSYRRGKEDIGDLDVVVTLNNRKEFSDSIDRLAQKKISWGLARPRFLVNDVQVDMVIAKPQNIGAAKLYFTGSKEFNIRSRMRAKKCGFLLNEEGLFTWPDGKLVTAEETEILKTLGMTKYMDPATRD